MTPKPEAKAFCIWREADGGICMQAGSSPPHPGDALLMRFEAAGWADAMTVLHKFMDQQSKLSGTKS